MNRLSTTRDSLRTSRQVLQQRWRDTQQDWNDSEAWAFGENYIDPLDRQAAAIDKELERLASVIEQARQRVT